MNTAHTVRVIMISTLVSITAVTVFAQGATTLGESCGSSSSTMCGLKDVKAIFNGVMEVIIAIGLPVLVVVVASRFVIAWNALREGNAMAYKEALRKAWQSLLGFFTLILILGGAVALLLNYLGASDSFMKIFNVISEGIVPHAHAQTYLPSPLKDPNTTLVSFLLDVVRLIMRFFVYPLLIIAWVGTGFAFVFAQGRPEMLTKAKKLLVGAIVSTLIVMMIQGFLMAVKGTTEQVLQSSSQK